MKRSLATTAAAFTHHDAAATAARRFLSTTTTTTQLRPTTDHDINAFRHLVGDKNVLTKQSINNMETRMEAYTVDWTKHYRAPDPESIVVVQPTTTHDVAAVVQYCAKNRIGIVPMAGNTGLVGGSMPLHHEIILSTRKLTQIYELDPISGILQCQAGVIVQTLQDYAATAHAPQHAHLLPMELGSRGTCCIGGTVATHAGGTYLYRYGSVAANLLGLQVVTGDGQILNLQSSNRKDTTGLPLHQLFAGSEGTLGVITEVSFLCHPWLPSRQTALLACGGFDHVLRTMALAKAYLGETLAALEWMDGSIVHAVEQNLGRSVFVRRPRHGTTATTTTTTDYYPHYLLVETHGSNEEHDRVKLESYLEAAMAAQTVADGILAHDMDTSQSLWTIRESANPSAAALGYTYKYDVSLPKSDFVGFIDRMRDRLSDLDIVHFNWGHVLDGNLHFNVTTVGQFARNEEILDRLEPYLFEIVHTLGGSISAEHGIGQAKNAYMTMIHDDATINAMRALKQVFDPHSIMNPGKVLPDV